MMNLDMPLDAFSHSQPRHDESEATDKIPFVMSVRKEIIEFGDQKLWVWDLIISLPS